VYFLSPLVYLVFVIRLRRKPIYAINFDFDFIFVSWNTGVFSENIIGLYLPDKPFPETITVDVVVTFT